jgi:hypothetical protein
MGEKMKQAVEQVRKTIRIDFHPLTPTGPFAVEKQDGEKKRRYLEGTTSGLHIDGHGERMTEHCIESFERQASSGDILLYAGKHDINYAEDIGRLVEFKMLDNGDWWTRYLLYEAEDGIGPVKMEIVNTVWAQANGLPPYTTPRGFGFSIEGDIPDGGILSMDDAGRRVIDDVKLTGVVLVRSPAYRTSVAHAVMKALKLPTAQEIRKALQGSFAEALSDKAKQKEEERDFYDQKYQLSDALEDMVSTIMLSPEPDKQDRLRDVLAQYGDLMVELILQYPEVWQEEAEDQPGDAGPSRVYEAEADGAQQDLHARLVTAHGQLQRLAERLRQEGADNGSTGKDVSDGRPGDPQ